MRHRTTHRQTSRYQRITGIATLALLGAAAVPLAVAQPGALLLQEATDNGTIAPSQTEEPVRVGGSAYGQQAAYGDPSAAVKAGLLPAPAKSAYQRAEQVMKRSDASCGLDWAALAAIGEIESRQGRIGSSALNRNGKATPAIIGIRLDGTEKTRRIADTDAGRLDKDRKFDRAVGPMQFIPSTWKVVAVDGDGDGVRDPQDIDDAALAAAVYLCSGPEDLSTEAGLQAAAHRYNRSTAYARTVVALAEGFRKGELPGAGDWTKNPLAALPAADRGSMTDPPRGEERRELRRRIEKLPKAESPRDRARRVERKKPQDRPGPRAESGPRTEVHPLPQGPRGEASPKPQPQPMPQPDGKPAPKPAPKPGPKPAPKPKPKPAPKPAPEPAATLESVLEACAPITGLDEATAATTLAGCLDQGGVAFDELTLAQPLANHLAAQAYAGDTETLIEELGTALAAEGHTVDTAALYANVSAYQS